MDKQTIKTVDGIISSEKVLSKIAPALLHLPIGRIKKNILLSKMEAMKGTQVVKSMPYKGVLNLTNSCNLHCSFCEIHYYHEKFEKTYSNYLGVDDIKKFEPWLKYLYQLDFYGSVGEPLLNPQFIDIIEYIKTQYGTRLFLNTNGTLLDSSIADALVRCGFDDVLISLHAGQAQTYQKLIGGDFEKVLGNIRNLINQKWSRKQDKPLIGIAFALNKINASDIEPFVEVASELGVNYIGISHYYDVRNRLEEDISYNSAPEEGNALLEWLYELSKRKRLTAIPATPPYLPQKHNVTERCTAPWSTIKFEGCMEYENSHYITVCNRIVLFRLNYNEYDFSKGVDAIWNHPVLQYMRGTVNCQSNPLCAFCRGEQTPSLRCLDNKEYRRCRDKAIGEFLREARKRFEMPEIKGLYLLERSPYE